VKNFSPCLPQEVHRQDEGEDGEDEREQLAAVVTDDRIDQAVDHAEQGFAHGLGAARDDFRARGDQRQEQHDHGEGHGHRQMGVGEGERLLPDEGQVHLDRIGQGDNLELV
jgi:hypothetical protein